MASVRERSRHAREDDEVTLNHLSVTVDTSLFPDTLKMKVQFKSDVVITSNRVTQKVSGLGWVDLELGSSLSRWAVTMVPYCPSRMVEHIKSK